jgi:hypothetical protein
MIADPPIPIPARERDAHNDHPNFFFDQETYVREMGAQHGFNYTAGEDMKSAVA